MTNIILMVVDALRYDCIGNVQSKILSKYDVKELLKTENMNRFTDNGVIFTEAISTAPDTPPAHASLFTGMYPTKHGIRTFFNAQLNNNTETIFEILKKEGYSTFCVADKPLFCLMELARGCEYNIDEGHSDKKLFALLQKHKDEELFIFQRFMDVHFPYFVSDSPPSSDYLCDSFRETERICEEYDIEFTLKDGDYDNIANHTEQWLKIREHLQNKKGVVECLLPLYIKGINKFDRLRFKNYIKNLEQMGILDDCLLILTADHGEAVIRSDKVEDGKVRFDHCYANIDELVHIPLVMYSPDFAFFQRKIVNAQVSIVDIMPTILSFLGISYAKERYQGQCLFPTIMGMDTGSSPAYSEHSWWNDGGYNDAKEFKKLFAWMKEGCNAAHDGTICQPLMRHRSIRTPTYRYVELGEEVTGLDFLEKDGKHFIRTLYRKIKANWDKLYEEDINIQVEKLANSEETRQSIMNKMMAEAKLANRYALYNLENDPYEEVNLLLVNSKRYGHIAEELKEIMERIK